MQIERLNLANFMCFAEYSLKLAPQFNLIVGNNGKGKTTILNGLSVGLGAAFLGFPEPAAARSIQRHEIHRRFFLQGQTLTAEPQFPCSVTCEGTLNERQGIWTRELASLEGRTTRQQANRIKRLAEQLQTKVQAGSEELLPVISCYGTERLWVQLSQTAVRTLSPGTRFQG